MSEKHGNIPHFFEFSERGTDEGESDDVDTVWFIGI
jgi:hypothetical protein